MALELGSGMSNAVSTHGDSRARGIAASGNLRAALFLPQHSSDPATGQLRGHGTGYIGIVMTQLLAQRLGVAAQIIGMPTPTSVMDALLAGDIDMAFFGIEPGRAAKVDFTPPIFQFDYTLMAPQGSPVMSIADADKPGTRIVIMDNHASALALKPLVKQATIVSAELPSEAFEILRSGKADVFASPRDVLLDYSEKLPDSRVLEEAFGVNRVGIAIRKERTDLLTFASAFVEESKTNGVIARAIDEGKLRGFSVAS